MYSLSDRKLKVPLQEPDIWLVDFSLLDEGDIDHSLLDIHEVHRLGRMKRPADRIAFASMRAAVKTLAKQYLGQEARLGDMQFCRHGKPFFPQTPQLHFNLSHSHGRGVIAFSSAGPVGVDIEPVARFQSLSSSFWRTVLAPSELYEASSSCDYAQSLVQWADIWVQKEAVLKMLGLGLAVPMKSFEVTEGHIIIAVPEAWQNSQINQNYLSACGVQSFAWDDYRWALCFSPDSASPKLRGALRGNFNLRKDGAILAN
tara:strand:+ start:22560 stop:23333 length:774 start_codon:yes stop_codon:yes gene_type:complete